MGKFLLMGKFINGQVLAHGLWLKAKAGPGPGPTPGGAKLGSGAACVGPRAILGGPRLWAGLGPRTCPLMNLPHQQELAH